MHDLFDILDETHVEHFVRLVEHQVGDRREVERAPADVVEDAARRADEVLVSSLGIDSSISSISKDGVISKSGADVYYNYLIYLLQLNGADEICSEPFNVALQLNFPKLYAQGYRLGYYREMPARQEEVSPANRLNQQQS